MKAPLFSLESVTKRIGHRAILRGIDLRLDAGESTLLLGNNGAGKTTLLRLLSGLARPSAGELRFRGETYSRGGAALRKAIGLLSHESRLYGDLTAAENLSLSGALYGVADLPRRILDALQRVHMDHVAGVPVRTFSSGMAKRVAIARILLCEPEVLLLDEPYSGLDQDSVQFLDAMLAEFQQKGGTLLMATHQFTPRTVACHRVLILHRGTLVYNQPQQDLTVERCSALLVEFAAGPAGSGS